MKYGNNISAGGLQSLGNNQGLSSQRQMASGQFNNITQSGNPSSKYATGQRSHQQKLIAQYQQAKHSSKSNNTTNLAKQAAIYGGGMQNLQYNNSKTQLGAPKVFSPQQNRGVKFHKPALDLFRKSETTDPKAISPLASSTPKANQQNFDNLYLQNQSSTPKQKTTPYKLDKSPQSMKVNPKTNYKKSQKTVSKKASNQAIAKSHRDLSENAAKKKTQTINSNGENFSFVDKNAVIKNSFSPPPVPINQQTNNYMKSNAQSVINLQRKVGTDQFVVDVIEETNSLSNQQQDPTSQFSAGFNYNDHGAKTTQSVSDMNLSKGQKTLNVNQNMQQSNAAFAAALDRKTISNSLQRQINSIQKKFDNKQLFSSHVSNKGQPSKTLQSYIKGNTKNSRRDRNDRSPLNYNNNSSSQPQFSQTSAQQQRTRIQKAPATATNVPSARILSHDKAANNNIIGSNLAQINAALTHAKSQTRAQNTGGLVYNKQGQLLKSGHNRRMEGVIYNPQPSPFTINNIKNDGDRLNFNSLDGENDIYQRQQDVEADLVQINSKRDAIRETERDALTTEGRQALQTDRSQGSFVQTANYMKNTKSRENRLNAKQVMSDSSPVGVYSHGSSSVEKKPVYQNSYKMYSQNAAKSARQNGGLVGMTAEQQKSLQKVPSQGYSATGLNTNFSVLSFDNAIKQKQQQIMQYGSQMNGPNNVNTARLLSADQNKLQQEGDQLNYHRRDRSQRISERNNKTNFNSDDFNQNDLDLQQINDINAMHDIDDTQVIQMGIEKGPNTDMHINEKQELLSASNQYSYQPNLDVMETYRKKMLSASVTQMSKQIKQANLAGNQASAISQRTPIPSQQMDARKLHELSQKQFSPNGARPMLQKSINFVQRNIKRAGQSKEKYAPKTHRGDKNLFDSTGQPSKDKAGALMLSPKTLREAPKNYGVNSVGSIGSIGSPGSLGSHNMQASKKTIKKQKPKEIIPTSSNIYGQTGTTGGTGTLVGTTGGTNQSAKLFANLKGMSAGTQDFKRKQTYNNLVANIKSPQNQNAKDSNIGLKTMKTARLPQAQPAVGDKATAFSGDLAKDSKNAKGAKTTLPSHQQSKYAQNNMNYLAAQTQSGSTKQQKDQSGAQTSRPSNMYGSFTLNQQKIQKLGQNFASMKAAAPSTQQQLEQMSGKNSKSGGNGPPRMPLGPGSASRSSRGIGQNQNSQVSSSGAGLSGINNISLQRSMKSRQSQNSNKSSQVQKAQSSRQSFRQGSRQGPGGKKTSKVRHHTGSQISQDSQQLNRSRVKPGADSQFIEQRPNVGDAMNNMYSDDDGDGEVEVEDIDDIQIGTVQDPTNRNASPKKPTRVQKPIPNTTQGKSKVMTPDEVDALNRSTEMKNRLRQKLNDKGYQVEFASSQGSETEPITGNNMIEIPSLDIYQNIQKNMGKKQKPQATSQHLKKKQQNLGPFPQLDSEQEEQQSLQPSMDYYDQQVPGQENRNHSQSRGVTASNSKHQTTYEDDLSQNFGNNSQLQMGINDSQITTESEVRRYNAFSQNLTQTGMIQSTIYHIRQYGMNIYDPDEREKYYSDDFLKNQRHVNDKVEQELVEFKVEIDEKVQQNSTRNFTFPRPGGEKIYMNTDSNVIDVSQSYSQYHDQSKQEVNQPQRGNNQHRVALLQQEFTDQNLSNLLEISENEGKNPGSRVEHQGTPTRNGQNKMYRDYEQEEYGYSRDTIGQQSSNRPQRNTRQDYAQQYR